MTLEALTAARAEFDRARAAYTDALQQRRVDLRAEIERTIGFTGSEPHGTLLCCDGQMCFQASQLTTETKMSWSWGAAKTPEILRPEAYHKAKDLLLDLLRLDAEVA